LETDVDITGGSVKVQMSEPQEKWGLDIVLVVTLTNYDVLFLAQFRA